MKTKAWEQYEQGVDYKTRIGLYSTVDLNERFFSGDQWVGIPHEGLPTPVVNFIKYASAWKIAAVTDRRLKMSFFAEGESDGSDISTYARQISAYCDMLWERLKMDYLTKEGLKQSAITGDYIQYFYWDPDIKTGQALKGDIGTSLIDNVNYYPGNPNSPDVQSQPYIILVFRELLGKVREEAKKNGCEDIDEITSDEDNEYTSGDRGKVELEDSGKCNVLLKMYKKDGRVFCEKSVKNVVIQPEKDSGLTKYPVSMMNWDTRKNCCHGTAEVTGLIPNQVFVNKILALAQLGQVQTSFPKVIYDRTRIREWTNKVAGAVAVNGDIGGAAQYLSPPATSYDAWRGLDVTLQTTMRMMGANDVTLGNIKNPDNTSAFIATRDAAMVPLQSQQERFYSFIEDIGLIWLDFIKSFYKTGRKIPVMDGGKRVFVPIPDGELDKFTMNLRIDVGPSSMWSEIQVLQTLDNLLRGGKISFKQYLERMPDGHIPLKDELMEDTERAENGEAQGRAGGAGDAGGAELAKAAAALAQAGKIPKELAAGVMKLAQQGADAGTILKALQTAAAQGKVPEEAVKAIAAAASGGKAQGAQGPQQETPQAAAQPPGQSAQQGAPQPPATAQPGQAKTGAQAPADLVKAVQALAQSGRIPKELAAGVMKLAQQGADSGAILKALQTAAAQGKIPEEEVRTIAEALGGAQGQAVKPQQPVQAAHGEEKTSAGPPAQQPGQPGGEAETAKIIEALAQNGKIPADTADALLKLIEAGAEKEAVIEALQNAAKQGKIPEETAQAVIQALGGGTSAQAMPPKPKAAKAAKKRGRPKKS